MTIGERIRYYRLKNGLKQHQLAELIGVSPQAISKWETDTGCPDISMLVPLARALGTTTDRLLDGQGEADTESEWDSMALAYEVFNNSPDSYSYTIEWPCVQQLLPELRGKRILDVGCGTGIFTFLLEQYFPEKVVGLDFSEGMLNAAREKGRERRSHADFLQGDAVHLADYFEEPFDLVFSSTTTHYIQDLKPLFEQIKAVLKPGGVCILSMIHPVYSAQYPIDQNGVFPGEEDWVVRYLDRRRRAYIQPWIEYNEDFENRLSRSFHHTFGDYINAILAEGLRIQEIREPMPPEHWKISAYGRYNNFIETPTFMVLKLVL